MHLLAINIQSMLTTKRSKREKSRHKSLTKANFSAMSLTTQLLAHHNEQKFDFVMSCKLG